MPENNDNKNENKKKSAFSLGDTRPLVVVLAIIIIIIIVLAFRVGSKTDVDNITFDMKELKNRIETLSFDLGDFKKKYDRFGGQAIALPCEGICEIGNGLFVHNVTANHVKAEKKVILSGEIINGMALRMDNIKMVFSWLAEYPFEVPSVGSGEAVPFTVVLKDVSEAPKEGAFVLKSADLYYQKLMKAGIK